jgi:hypothetical protein
VENRRGVWNSLPSGCGLSGILPTPHKPSRVASISLRIGLSLSFHWVEEGGGNTGYTNPIKSGDPVVASLDPKWPPQAQFRQGVTIPPVETRGHLLVHAKGLHYPYI